ncbi:MAG TPA: PQQ-binding-like beta-propeller repeat protein [Draconibacterium sp.]|jgi:outer membrane protein assembly factor BamB|nr:PQQ-binding-like beta-propeller repeat protein [Draconibacterium sp.]
MKFILYLLFIFSAPTLFSQEITEFRGIQRTGHFNESGLLKQWPEAGPELLLKIEGIGKGYSHPVLVEDIIFVTGIKKDTTDVLSAYNLKGELLWETVYGRSWTKSYTDSRSTPTFEDGKIYVSSGTGQVNCVDAKTGKIIWQVDAINNYKGEIYNHGDAENPLIVDDLVVFTTGGEENTMVALKKTDGSLVWKTKSLGGAKAYASPVLIEHNGLQMILAQTSKNLIAINPANGEIHWHYDLIRYHLNRQGTGANTNPPLYWNGEIFVTSGYDHPGIKLALSPDGKSVQEIWKNDTIDTHHGGVVLVDGNLYGSNWKNNANGQWASVNWETGRTNWETEWYNKGSTIYADGMLYIYEEKSGNVALVEPSPENLKIISTFKVTEGEGPHWAHPAIYDRKLFIRHGNVLMVYDIKK